MRLGIAVLLVSFLFIAGCASTPVKEETGSIPSASGSGVQQLQARIAQLEGENLSLRQELEETKQAEVRMPTGKEIQSALKNAGFYSGNIDGAIGTQTKEAIKKFQAANNLNPDGSVGSRTWEKLSEHLKQE